MNHECRTEATEADITQVLGPELLNKYRDFSLNQAISKLDGVHRCQTPECPYAFVLEGNLNDFTCPLCKVSYCLKCNDVKHDGVTCEDMKLLKRPAYEEDKELIILAQEKKLEVMSLLQGHGRAHGGLRPHEVPLRQGVLLQVRWRI